MIWEGKSDMALLVHYLLNIFHKAMSLEKNFLIKKLCITIGKFSDDPGSQHEGNNKEWKLENI